MHGAQVRTHQGQLARGGPFIVICECLLSIVQFKKTVYASLMDWCMQGLSAAFSFVRELYAHQPRNDSGFTFLKYKRMALYP